MGLPESRPGELIVRLHPSALDRSKINPLGLSIGIIELLGKLRRDHGLKKVQPLWPLGTGLAQPVTALVLKLLGKRWKGLLDELIGVVGGEKVETEGEFSVDEWATRLRLRIQLDPAKPTAEALKLVLQAAGVQYAENVPYRWCMAVEPNTKQEVKDAFKPKKPPKDDEGQFNYGPDGYWQRTKIGVTAGLPFALRSIAVLDSGCDEAHPALQGAASYGTQESRRDLSGHGTFVCGLLAARSQAAVVDPDAICDVEDGMLPKARLWANNIMDPEPYEWAGRRYFSVDPGRYSLALSRLAKAGSVIKVVNLSVGSNQEMYQTEQDDLMALEKAGIVVVAAAGNADEGASFKPAMYPALYPQVVSVGAIGFPGDRLWPRTCSDLPVTYTGDRESGVDVWAPGEWILSTLPMDANNAKGLPFSGWMHGTSMAAPLVTAAVAVLRELYPEDGPAEARERLLSQCCLQGWDAVRRLTLFDFMNTVIAQRFPDGW